MLRSNKVKIIENKNKKVLLSKNYKYTFDKQTGFFARWGNGKDDDPQFSPWGPEILDLEISSGGDCKGGCKFCYKSNGGDQPTHNMTFEEFKVIFDKMPKTLTQIAYGIMDIYTNPDFFKIMKYARQNGVIPNYTCHGLDLDKNAIEKTVELCGAVAVSIVNKEKTYDAIFKLTNAGMKQVNIHFVLCQEFFGKALQVIDDIVRDKRLEKLNAIVFLQYKAKGRNTGDFHSILDVEKYRKLTQYCEDNNVNYGFDSCSAPIFLESIQDRPDKEKIEVCVEPCESGLFSSYVNCHGQFFVCSFAENEDEWKEGIDVLNCDNFMKDVWMNERLIQWRKRLIENKRNCPIYDLAYA